MKKLIFIFAVLLLAYGCEKDEPVPEPLIDKYCAVCIDSAYLGSSPSKCDTKERIDFWMNWQEENGKKQGRNYKCHIYASNVTW